MTRRSIAAAAVLGCALLSVRASAQTSVPSGPTLPPNLGPNVVPFTCDTLLTMLTTECKYLNVEFNRPKAQIATGVFTMGRSVTLVSRLSLVCSGVAGLVSSAGTQVFKLDPYGATSEPSVIGGVNMVFAFGKANGQFVSVAEIRHIAPMSSAVVSTDRFPGGPVKCWASTAHLDGGNLKSYYVTGEMSDAATGDRFPFIATYVQPAM